MTNDSNRAVKPADAVLPPTNADKARALMALLDGDGGAGIPPARLQDWARDLVETIERSGPPVADPKERIAIPAIRPRRMAKPRLFAGAAPVLVERAPPLMLQPAQRVAPPAPKPPVTVPVAPRPVVVPHASAAPLHPGIAGAAVTPASTGLPPSRLAPPAILARASVARLIAATVDPLGDPALLAREHTVVIAMTLLGKSTLQQASALRMLPGGQMRAVHRALRRLEAREQEAV